MTRTRRATQLREPVTRWQTRGQDPALAVVRRMIAGTAPHAVLVVGPPSVGKTTIALDLAAGLLCSAADPRDRPCRACRSCRLVAVGGHPDLHLLGPEGPGGQVVIGEPDDPRKPRGVRDLLHELAFLPVEGASRVAVIDGAAQMNVDAQHALLKTLEEPPPGVTIALCADSEEALLPTVRSRCARIRLRPTSPRDIEELLGELDLADPPLAARLARIADGRPGLAVAYARVPDAIAIRDEIARSLVDLLAVGRARRLEIARDLLARSRELADALTPGSQRPGASDPASAAGPGAEASDRTITTDAEEAALDAETDRRLSPAERRRGARVLLDIWRDLARDLALVAAHGRNALRDPALLEELETAASQLEPGRAILFLERLSAVSELVAGNANPELAIDVLALAWPPSTRAAA